MAPLNTLYLGVIVCQCKSLQLHENKILSLNKFQYGEPGTAQQVAMDRKGLLVKCVLEAIRLRGPGIDVRFCSTDVTMPRGEGPPVVIPKVSSLI